MLTHTLLDEVLPDGVELVERAEKLSGLILRGMSDGDVIKFCLEWAARVTESDRHWGMGDQRPAWRDTERYETPWSIEMRGLEYKASSCYLTAEGWPTGTTCWYVCVESGWREYVGADTPKVAVLRAVIVMATAARIREIAPSKRPKLADALREPVAIAA